MKQHCWMLLVLTANCMTTAAAPIVYEKQIRPILKASCFHCHGEEADPKGGLDLRLARLIHQGGESGPAIVAGKPDDSLLIAKLEAEEMPPGDKKLTKEQISLLRQWIEQGGKTARPEPENTAGLEFSDEDRSYWAFQPIRRPAPTTPKNSNLVRTPIDAFLLTALETQGLSFAPLTDRATLIRRLAFDLTGLPPTPAEIADFVNDQAPGAVERLVDCLLDSPHYGERWARHWLDVAGYADSNGYTTSDKVRPYAYKYRDYVIRSINDDKPWDQFLIEQLAGDELIKPPFVDLPPPDLDRLIATGFLRMGPDGTEDAGVDQALARNEVMAETLKIVSTAVLGMTVGCAQCHHHRFDPITQADYYRLRAVFEPAYDVSNWKTPTQRQISSQSAADRARAIEVDQQIAAVNQERTARLNALVEEVFQKELAKLPADQQDFAKASRATDAKARSAEQKELLRKNPSLNVSTGNVRLYDRSADKINKEYDDKVAALKKDRPAEDFVACLTEMPGKVPVTRLFERGDHRQPKQEVAPGDLSVLSAVAASSIPAKQPDLPTTGRRLAYARHLTSGQHPLTARVLVNRFWMHHFGRGIVATPGDFGAFGQRPTHPELLDWLANEFMSGGWKLKPLHRLMVLSTAYQQISIRTSALEATDPENRLLGRMSVRRLEAEEVRDAVLAVVGNLNRKMYGPPLPVAPDDLGQVVLGADTRDTAGRPLKEIASLGEEALRRSLYVQVRRSLPLSILEAFDAPLMSPNCEQRNASTVAPQSLFFLNNRFVIEQSETWARQLSTLPDATTRLTEAWLRAFGDAPTPAEMAAAETYLTDQQALLPVDPKNPAATRALASLCQALLSSNRFLYVD